MRLIALRGANTVAANEADAILDATEALMREMLGRNGLATDDLVSCLFTLTPDLDAEFPAVAARRIGLGRVPLMCAQEIGVPGAMRSVIRVLIHAYADARHEPSTSTWARPRRSARTCTPRSRLSAAMPIEFAERIRRIPVYPAADGYALSGDVALLASNETPYPPLQAVQDAIAKALGGLNRYPDPTNSALRQALSDRFDVPAHRIAIGNGSCDILLAAGEALLEPGAEVVYAWPSFSVYPHLAAASGARAIEVPVDERHGHDLDAMLAEITAATRLVIVCNPNNPTSTALPLEDIAAFVAAVPRHVAVILDEAYCEFNLLQDPDESLDLLGRAPEPRPPADVLQGLRALRAARRLRAVRLGGLPRRGRPGPPALLLQRGRPGRGDRGAPPPGRGRRRVERTVAERLELESGLRELGIEPADSQANFVWFDLPDADEERDVTGLAERTSSPARARRSAARRPPCHVGTEAENRKFLGRAGDVLAAQPDPG